MKQKILKSLPAFSERNFRIYFASQLVSLSGTSMQTAAMAWLAYQLTGKNEASGTVVACSFLPVCLCVLFGGVIIDRFQNRNVLYVTQTISMCLALCMAAAYFFGFLTFPILLALATLIGFVNAADTPAHVTIVSELLGGKKELLPSAISINSSVSNSSQVIGPALAGIVIAAFGTGWVFVINALSFVAVLAALARLDLSATSEKKPVQHPLAMIRDGLAYVAGNRHVLFLMAVTFFVAFLGRTVSTVFPGFASSVYQTGSVGYGVLLAAFGLGAVPAALMFHEVSKKASTRLRITLGAATLGLSILFFGMTDRLPIALSLLFLAGFSWVFVFSTINSVIQGDVPSEMKGRAISVMLFVFYGCFLSGSWLIGYLADHFGLPLAAMAYGACMVSVGFALLFFKSHLEIHPQPEAKKS